LLFPIRGEKDKDDGEFRKQDTVDRIQGKEEEKSFPLKKRKIVPLFVKRGSGEI